MKRRNFSGKDLSHTSVFMGKDLSDAMFVGTNLYKANFHKALLRGTDFRISFACQANFSNTHSNCANFSGAILDKADFRGADLRNAVFYGASLMCAKLNEANLEGVAFRGACLTDADLQGIQGYGDSEAIFVELLRRRVIDLCPRELEMVGEVLIYGGCWGKLVAKFKDSPLPLLERLARAGWDEYLNTYRSFLEMYYSCED